MKGKMRGSNISENVRKEKIKAILKKIKAKNFHRC